MSIDASFYKNVFLLMQAVPASFECTKHFKKGMFDKPNTLGFIHISHYLLSVYNAAQFQRMVTWPILNKADEKNYRTKIKDYVEVLANENPDINFPPILMSHLFQAGGIRFLTIMWKISEISLRAHIARNYQAKLLQAPNTGNADDITRIHLTNLNLKRSVTISKFYEKTKSTLKSFKHYMQENIDDLKRVQTDIFNTMENIKKHIHVAPVSPLITTQLVDPENSEIISLWKTNIDENIKFLWHQNSNLNKLQSSSNTLHNIILSTCVNCTILDGNNLPKVNTQIVPLCFNSKQHIDNGLYKNGCLVFHSLLLTFNQTLKQIEGCLKINNLSDISNYQSEITEYCKTIKFMEETFQKFVVEVSDMLHNVQCTLQEKSVNYTLETDFFYSMHREIMSSRKFDFYINESVDDKQMFERLHFSPLQGTYKHLFKRYKRYHFPSPKRSMGDLQLNNNIHDTSMNWLSPQRQSLIYRKNSPNTIKVSPRYSRLFSPSNSKRFKDHNAVSTPKESGIGETPKKSQIPSTQSDVVNIDAAVKNIFDLSRKITSVVASLSNSYSNNNS